VFRISNIVISIGLLFVCLPGTARAERVVPQVNVSVYNDAGVSSATLRRAQQQAGRILRMAGLNVAWIDSQSRNASRHDQHGGPLYTTEFSLRIVPHSGNLADRVFGVSFLGADGSGRYGDIFYDTAERLTETAHINLADVLGHVIAHELGHLLLGTNAHSPEGIMRPHWSSDELRSLARGRLLFMPQQAQSIRNRATHPLADKVSEARGF
jgi:hypothetical protein